MTRQAVLEIFPSFSERFEGRLPFMYLDVKGLVTTGIGNLIDPAGAALGLPWLRPDGSRASADEIAACWNVVKDRQDLRLRGGVVFGSLPGNTLRLAEAAISDLVLGRLAGNETVLRRRYPGFDDWPADAQLGIHSMAWAMGPAFHFPRFAAAVNGDPPDFGEAARECRIENGAILRNDANRRLFTNAEIVARLGLDPGRLYYPGLPDTPQGAA